VQHRGSLAFVLVLIGAACGGGDAAPPDALQSICGQPGDEGNEVGVGKFCETLTDCSDTDDAPLCANLGDPQAYFCTRTCTEGDSSVCGTDAECTCGNGGCGCTPTACLD
jgi:hypothetical protein